MSEIAHTAKGKSKILIKNVFDFWMDWFKTNICFPTFYVCCEQRNGLRWGSEPSRDWLYYMSTTKKTNKVRQLVWSM